jgi:hypothetical protein
VSFALLKTIYKRFPVALIGGGRKHGNDDIYFNFGA